MKRRLVTICIQRISMRKIIGFEHSKTNCAKSTRIKHILITNKIVIVPSLLTYEKVLIAIISNHFHGNQNILKY